MLVGSVNVLSTRARLLEYHRYGKYTVYSGTNKLQTKYHECAQKHDHTTISKHKSTIQTPKEKPNQITPLPLQTAPCSAALFLTRSSAIGDIIGGVMRAPAPAVSTGTLLLLQYRNRPLVRRCVASVMCAPHVRCADAHRSARTRVPRAHDAASQDG